MPKKIFFVLCLLISFNLKAQNKVDTILKKNITIIHFGDLSSLVNKISEKYNIKFNYDTSKFDKISELQLDFDNITLEEALKKICNITRSKYIINNIGKIYIIDKFIEVDPGKINVTIKQELKKEYKGAPTKKNFTISGRVIDKKTGESLPYANVGIANSKINIIANVDGLFTLTNIPNDTLKILANNVGYETLEYYLTPTTVLNNLVLELEQPELFNSQVVVFSKIPNILKANDKVGVIKLTPSKLNVLPNLGEKDILRALQLMPGVSAANENSAGLYVRGGTPDQSLVIYDGFTVYNVDHLFGFFSAFNANAIKDVQLYKGSFDAKYGGRLSSVAEFTGKEGSSKKMNYGGDISLMSFNGFFETPINDKSTFFIAGRRSYKGPLYNTIFKQFNPETTSPTGRLGGGSFGGRGFQRFGASNSSELSSFFYDLNSKYTYRPNKKDVISLSFFSGGDDLNNSTKINPPSFLSNTGVNLSFDNSDITNWGNIGSSAKWSRRWSSKLYSNTLASFSNYYSQRNLSNSGSIVKNDSTINFKTGTFEDNQLLDYSIKSDFELKFNELNKLEFGGQVNNFDVKYKYAQNDTSTIIDRHTNGNLIAGYLQDKVEVYGFLKLTFGGRINYFQPTKKYYIEPRLNLTYNLTDKLLLKGSAGRYYQFIKRVIKEDIQQGSRDFWVLSDGEKLPIAYNDQISFGGSYESKDYLFDVEAYNKNLFGLSEYSLRINRQFGGPGGPGQNNNTLIPVESFLQGTGKAKGIDFLIQKKSGKFNGWIAYSLGEVTNNYPAYKIGDFYASNDVTHEFKVVGIYKWHDWDFSSTWIYATGKPYTSVDGGYSQSLPDGTTRTFYIVSDKNANRLTDYHRLDIATTYNIKFERHGSASLSFSIFNVYNRKNEWYKMFSSQSNYIVETTKNFLGITPNLTLTYKFQ
jgi:hypothetical protein